MPRWFVRLALPAFLLLASMARCPEVKAETEKAAMRQAMNWLVAVSIAAKKDLTPVFLDRWRMPIGKETRLALGKVDWGKGDVDPSAIIKGLPTDPPK